MTVYENSCKICQENHPCTRSPECKTHMLWQNRNNYFTSPINRNLLQLIKGDRCVLSRVGALTELNLEYLAIDSQGFTTDNDIALEQLFGEHSEGTRDYD